MQKRKFDELISHFNRKVADMSINQKYKMELLGMISAIGFAHENELSTDCISRQAAIDALKSRQDNGKGDISRFYNTIIQHDIEAIEQLPPAQPDIVRCRNCKFASGDSRICMKFDHSPIGELDFCAWAERRTDEE